MPSKETSARSANIDAVGHVLPSRMGLRHAGVPQIAAGLLQRASRQHRAKKGHYMASEW